MISFTYPDGSSIKTGQITVISASLPIEAEIQADGWNFHIIAGKHRDGNYICIPNWNIGSELAGLSDTFWNSERLAACTGLGEQNSCIIASALAELSQII